MAGDDGFNEFADICDAGIFFVKDNLDQILEKILVHDLEFESSLEQILGPIMKRALALILVPILEPTLVQELSED